jgi:hypothetical protein
MERPSSSSGESVSTLMLSSVSTDMLRLVQLAEPTVIIRSSTIISFEWM